MDLQQQHRAQQKDLQTRIQSLKKTVNATDKKRKKEIAAQVAAMREELESRQEQELLALCPIDRLSYQMDQVHVDHKDDDASASGFKYEIRGVCKAEKKKEKKREAARKRREASEQEDVSAITESRERESEKLASLIASKSLSIHSIASDGDCLYNSVKHQLSQQGIQVSVKELRHKAADHMRTHRNSFRPFIPTEEGEMISDQQFERYCHTLETSKEWGGNLELEALSQALQCPVHVFQADAPIIEFGPQFQHRNTILLSYHRHEYRLGEHYNSLVPK